MKNIYPFWSSLSDEEKKIVEDIAMQIPIRCEDVAHMFRTHGNSDRQTTIKYIYTEYGFAVI